MAPSSILIDKSCLKELLVVQKYLVHKSFESVSKRLCSPATMVRKPSLPSFESALLPIMQDEAVMACLELMMVAVQRKDPPEKALALHIQEGPWRIF